VVNALGAGLLILLTFALGSLLFNQRAGLLGAAIVATTPRLVLIAQKSIIDTYFTLFVTAALFFFGRLFLAWAADHRPRTTDKPLFYVALGLGVLTKGPLALVLLGGVIFCYLLATRRWLLLRRMNVPLGLLILLMIILPWYVAIYWKLGWEPIATFIFRENVGRFTSDIDWSNRGPFYYVTVLLGDFFPWSLYLIPVGILSYRAWRQKEELQHPVAFLLWWMAFTVIFFSLARNKHEYYLLPLYPAAAVLIGRLFVDLMDETVENWARRGAQIITVTVGILLIVGGVILALVVNRVLLAPLAAYSLLILVGGGLWLLWQVRRQSLKRVPLSLVGLMLAGVLLYQIVCLPVIEPYRPTKALCDVIAREARPEDLVGAYNFAAPSMTFYLRRKIFEVFQPEVIHEILQSDRRVFCLVPEGDFYQLEQTLPGRLTILERRPMLTLRLNALWDAHARERMPHLLLITNSSIRHPPSAIRHSHHFHSPWGTNAAQ
jgi:4-amino-4-deoxy-L-arabinose transferase-like glycosyltransferase